MRILPIFSTSVSLMIKILFFIVGIINFIAIYDFLEITCLGGLYLVLSLPH